MDYKKKYDEALKVASQWHKDGIGDIKNVVECIFPELKKPDDEKIRKEIVLFLREGKPYYCPDSVKRQEWSNWLEKQCEDKHCRDVCGDSRFKIIEKAKKDIISSTNIETSQDEMNVLDNILYRCWQMGWLEKYDKQKYTYYKEDENIKEEIAAYIYKTTIVNFPGKCSKEQSEKWIDWLKSLKPQNVWISVDEEVYVKEPVLAQKKDKSDQFLGFVVCCDHTLTPNVYECYMILGGIVSQNTWKPSGEQMIALRWVLNNIPYNKHKEVISQMVEELKNL